MGGEQSAFRSLVPSASSAAVALLAGLRQHQQQQMDEERRRMKSSLEVDESVNSAKDIVIETFKNGKERKRPRDNRNSEDSKASEENIDGQDDRHSNGEGRKR